MARIRFPSWIVVLLVSFLAVCLQAAAAPPAAAPAMRPVTVTPVSRAAEPWWMPRHEAICARVKKGDVGLIFIGDSITHGWEGGGKEIWQKYYAKRNAVNMGFGGDRTEHVLWRLAHGEIDGIAPKLAVIMIGTNNSGSNTPGEIAEGVKAIIRKLQSKLPETKILLLGIFPRGADDRDGLRKVNVKTNRRIAQLANGKSVFYLDIGPKFLEKDGTLSKEIMPDRLHPNTRGYTIWAEATEPMVARLMGE